MDQTKSQKPDFALPLFFACSFLLILPSLVVWWRRTEEPLLITFFEYDYFLGLLGADYWGKGVGLLLLGKFLHLLFFAGAGYGFWRYVVSQGSAADPVPPSRGIALAVLAGMLYLCGQSWMSPDVFFYFGTGWMEVNYGGNPYVHLIAQIPGFDSDPMFQNIISSWFHIITPYGPLFVKIAATVAGLSGGNQENALLIFKGLCAAAHACNCLLAWQIAGKLGANKNATLLAWGLNPLVLFTLLAANHNDVFLILCLLSAIYFATEEKAFPAVLALGVGVGVKYMPIFVFPFLVLYLTRKDPLPKAAGRAFLLGVVFLAVGLAPSFLYEGGLGNFLRLLKGQDQLFRNFLYVETWRLIGRFGPVTGAEYMERYNYMKWAFKALFVGLYAMLWLRAFRLRERFDMERLLQACTLAFVVYFLIGSPEMHEWYLPWFLPFAFFCRDRRFFRFGMALSTCFLPFIIFEVKAPKPFTMAATIGFFAVMWVVVYLCLIRPRKRPGISPLYPALPGTTVDVGAAP